MKRVASASKWNRKKLIFPIDLSESYGKWSWLETLSVARVLAE
jgi:hypothetical protein